MQYQKNMKSAKAESPTTLPSDGFMPLESVLGTEELKRRATRLPDYEVENRALVALARALSDSPQTILQDMTEIVLEALRADSCGISLLTEDDGGKNYYWPAIAGAWKSHIGGGAPRIRERTLFVQFGPCRGIAGQALPQRARDAGGTALFGQRLSRFERGEERVPIGLFRLEMASEDGAEIGRFRVEHVPQIVRGQGVLQIDGDIASPECGPGFERRPDTAEVGIKSGLEKSGERPVLTGKARGERVQVEAGEGYADIGIVERGAMPGLVSLPVTGTHCPRN